jgi:uncharacterized membrane protein
MSNDTTPMRPNQGWLEPGKANVQLIYILYLVGFVIGISAIVGIVLAHLNRGKSEPWLETHYTWAIRTFWIAFLAGIVSAILVIVGIGVLLMIAIAIWVIVRCIIGLQAVGRNEPIRDPQSWLI